MKLSALTQAGRTPDLPLVIDLSMGELTFTHLLRVLPNQRYVGKAIWQDKTVLAKLFVGSRASKHYQRELAGVTLLAKQQIDTPKLLAHQVNEQGGYLLFEYLEHSQTLDHSWQQLVQQPFLSAEQLAVLQTALTAIAQLHLQGIWQEDLHLDNLLQQNQNLFWIDGDGIKAERIGHPLSTEKVMANLAIFFAQLPPSLDNYLTPLLTHYQLHNNHVTLSLIALKQAITKFRNWRVKNIQKKIRRDCTLFSVKNTAHGYYGVWRTEESTLAPVLANPDHYIEQGRFIKGFGTTNVIDTVVNGLHIVLKRYNIKSFTHRLSRFWRPTRGWHSWEAGFRLQMLGIPTAKPLALIEERHCFMRARAWLITEYLDGPDLLTHLKPYENSKLPTTELNSLKQLFSLLIRFRISHGDLKGTNLFWVNNAWVLIDLDAVKQHRSISSFKKAYGKDRARFLRNWSKDSALHQLLDNTLPRPDEIN